MNFREYCEATSARDAAWEVLHEVKNVLMHAGAYEAFDLLAKEHDRIMSEYPAPNITDVVNERAPSLPALLQEQCQ